MTRKHKSAIKAISLLLAFIFAFSEISYAAPFEAAPPRELPLQVIAQDPTRFEAPVKFTTLKEVHKGDKNTFIIHIQDAHANYSGQANLAGALDEIMTRYQVTLVLVEGGTKDDTLTPLKKIAPPEVWKKVAKKFLIEGKITGDEYLNLISDHPMKIMGIENKELYMTSLKAYGDLAGKREEILDYLKEIQSAVNQLKRKLYPKELLEYEKQEAGGNFEKKFKGLLELISAYPSRHSEPSARHPERSEGSQKRDSSLASLVQNDAATSQDDILQPFPTVQKLKAIQDQEKTINFDAANLEQAALIEEIAKRAPNEIPRLSFDSVDASLRIARDDKINNVSLFCHFQNTLNSAKRKKIPLENYPNLIAYGEYLRSFQELDLDQVLDELEKVEDKVYVSLLTQVDSRQKTVDRKGSEKQLLTPVYSLPSTEKDALLVRSVDRYIGLLETAYRIQMSTKEFNLFKVNEPDFATVAYLAFVNRKLAETGYFTDLIAYKNLLEDGKKSLEAFYDSVNQRDMAFMQNVEKILKQENQQVAVLITGGYHTPHLKKLFKEKGYSFAVLTPIITSETNQKKYEKILLEPIRKETKTVEVAQGESKTSDKRLSDLEQDLIKLKKQSDQIAAVRLAEPEAATRLAELIQSAGQPGQEMLTAETALEFTRGNRLSVETLGSEVGGQKSEVRKGIPSSVFRPLSSDKNGARPLDDGKLGARLAGADGLLKVIGLSEGLLQAQNKEISQRNLGDLTIKTIRINKRTNPLSIPKGIEILDNELAPVRNFDLLYRKGRLIAVFPILNLEEIKEVLKGTPEKKITTTPAGFESYVLKHAKFLDLSAYYFDVPKFDSKMSEDKVTKVWKDFGEQWISDRAAIEKYKNTPDVQNPLKKGIASHTKYITESGFESKPYVYVELTSKGGLWTLSQFNPDEYDHERYKKKPDAYQLIFRVFPGIYHPAQLSSVRTKEAFFRAVFGPELDLKKGHITLDVGSGTGIVAWTLWLSVKRPGYAIGLSDMETANILDTAEIAGMPITAVTNDNIVKDGKPLFEKVDRLTWDMPYISNNVIKPILGRIKLDEYWDGGQEARRTLETFGANLRQVLKGSGRLLIWHEPWSERRSPPGMLPHNVDVVKETLEKGGIRIEDTKRIGYLDIEGLLYYGSLSGARLASREMTRLEEFLTAVATQTQYLLAGQRIKNSRLFRRFGFEQVIKESAVYKGIYRQSLMRMRNALDQERLLYGFPLRTTLQNVKSELQAMTQWRLRQIDRNHLKSLIGQINRLLRIYGSLHQKLVRAKDKGKFSDPAQANRYLMHYAALAAHYAKQVSDSAFRQVHLKARLNSLADGLKDWRPGEEGTEPLEKFIRALYAAVSHARVGSAADEDREILFQILSDIKTLIALTQNKPDIEMRTPDEQLLLFPSNTSGSRLSASLVDKRDELRRTRADQEPTFASSFVTRLFRLGNATRTASESVWTSVSIWLNRFLTSAISSLSEVVSSPMVLISFLNDSINTATSLGVNTLGSLDMGATISKNFGLVKSQNDVSGARLAVINEFKFSKRKIALRYIAAAFVGAVSAILGVSHYNFDQALNKITTVRWEPVKYEGVSAIHVDPDRTKESSNMTINLKTNNDGKLKQAFILMNLLDPKTGRRVPVLKNRFFEMRIGSVPDNKVYVEGIRVDMDDNDFADPKLIPIRPDGTILMKIESKDDIIELHVTPQIVDKHESRFLTFLSVIPGALVGIIVYYFVSRNPRKRLQKANEKNGASGSASKGSRLADLKSVEELVSWIEAGNSSVVLNTDLGPVRLKLTVDHGFKDYSISHGAVKIIVYPEYKPKAPNNDPLSELAKLNQDWPQEDLLFNLSPPKGSIGQLILRADKISRDSSAVFPEFTDKVLVIEEIQQRRGYSSIHDGVRKKLNLWQDTVIRHLDEYAASKHIPLLSESKEGNARIGTTERIRNYRDPYLENRLHWTLGTVWLESMDGPSRIWVSPNADVPQAGARLAASNAVLEKQLKPGDAFKIFRYAEKVYKEALQLLRGGAAYEPAVQQDLREAAVNFEVVRSIHPRHQMALARLATIYELLGNKEKASQYWSEYRYFSNSASRNGSRLGAKRQSAEALVADGGVRHQDVGGLPPGARLAKSFILKEDLKNPVHFNEAPTAPWYNSSLNRHLKQWQWFHQNALHQIITKAKSGGKKAGRYQINVLVLGASTGEELARSAYEILLQLQSQNEDLNEWHIDVQGMERNNPMANDALRRLSGQDPLVWYPSPGDDGNRNALDYSNKLVTTLNRYKSQIKISFGITTADYTEEKSFEDLISPDIILANMTLYRMSEEKIHNVFEGLDKRYPNAWMATDAYQIGTASLFHHKVSSIGQYSVAVPINTEEFGNPATGSRLAKEQTKVPDSDQRIATMRQKFEEVGALLDQKQFEEVESKLSEIEKLAEPFESKEGILSLTEGIRYTKKLDRKGVKIMLDVLGTDLNDDSLPSPSSGKSDQKPAPLPSLQRRTFLSLGKALPFLFGGGHRPPAVPAEKATPEDIRLVTHMMSYLDHMKNTITNLDELEDLDDSKMERFAGLWRRFTTQKARLESLQPDLMQVFEEKKLTFIKSLTIEIAASPELSTNSALYAEGMYVALIDPQMYDLWAATRFAFSHVVDGRIKFEPDDFLKAYASGIRTKEDYARYVTFRYFVPQSMKNLKDAERRLISEGILRRSKKPVQDIYLNAGEFQQDLTNSEADSWDAYDPTRQWLRKNRQGWFFRKAKQLMRTEFAQENSMDFNMPSPAAMNPYADDQYHLRTFSEAWKEYVRQMEHHARQSWMSRIYGDVQPGLRQPGAFSFRQALKVKDALSLNRMSLEDLRSFNSEVFLQNLLANLEGLDSRSMSERQLEEIVHKSIHEMRRDVSMNVSAIDRWEDDGGKTTGARLAQEETMRKLGFKLAVGEANTKQKRITFDPEFISPGLNIDLWIQPHGATPLNEKKMVQGRAADRIAEGMGDSLSTSLNAFGAWQAQQSSEEIWAALGEKLKNHEPVIFLRSPQKRSIQSADQFIRLARSRGVRINDGITTTADEKPFYEVKVYEDLAEIDRGQLDFKALTELDQDKKLAHFSQSHQRRNAFVRPPEGESFIEFADRVDSFLRHINTEYASKTVVILGASGTWIATARNLLRTQTALDHARDLTYIDWSKETPQFLEREKVIHLSQEIAAGARLAKVRSFPKLPEADISFQYDDNYLRSTRATDSEKYENLIAGLSVLEEIAKILVARFNLDPNSPNFIDYRNQLHFIRRIYDSEESEILWGGGSDRAIVRLNAKIPWMIDIHPSKQEDSLQVDIGTEGYYKMASALLRINPQSKGLDVPFGKHKAVIDKQFDLTRLMDKNQQAALIGEIEKYFVFGDYVLLGNFGNAKFQGDLLKILVKLGSDNSPYFEIFRNGNVVDPIATGHFELDDNPKTLDSLGARLAIPIPATPEELESIILKAHKYPTEDLLSFFARLKSAVENHGVSTEVIYRINKLIRELALGTLSFKDRTFKDSREILEAWQSVSHSASAFFRELVHSQEINERIQFFAELIFDRYMQMYESKYDKDIYGKGIERTLYVHPYIARAARFIHTLGAAHVTYDSVEKPLGKRIANLFNLYYTAPPYRDKEKHIDYGDGIQIIVAAAKLINDSGARLFASPSLSDLATQNRGAAALRSSRQKDASVEGARLAYPVVVLKSEGEITLDISQDPAQLWLGKMLVTINEGLNSKVYVRFGGEAFILEIGRGQIEIHRAPVPQAALWVKQEGLRSEVVYSTSQTAADFKTVSRSPVILSYSRSGQITITNHGATDSTTQVSGKVVAGARMADNEDHNSFYLSLARDKLETVWEGLVDKFSGINKSFKEPFASSYAGAMSNLMTNVRSLIVDIDNILRQIDLNPNSLEESLWKAENILLKKLNGITDFIRVTDVRNLFNEDDLQKLISDEGALTEVKTDLEQFISGARLSNQARGKRDEVSGKAKSTEDFSSNLSPLPSNLDGEAVAGARLANAPTAYEKIVRFLNDHDRRELTFAIWDFVSYLTEPSTGSKDAPDFILEMAEDLKDLGSALENLQVNPYQDSSIQIGVTRFLDEFTVKIFGDQSDYQVYWEEVIAHAKEHGYELCGEFLELLYQYKQEKQGGGVGARLAYSDQYSQVPHFLSDPHFENLNLFQLAGYMETDLKNPQFKKEVYAYLKTLPKTILHEHTSGLIFAEDLLDILLKYPEARKRFALVYESKKDALELQSQSVNPLFITQADADRIFRDQIGFPDSNPASHERSLENLKKFVTYKNRSGDFDAFETTFAYTKSILDMDPSLRFELVKRGFLRFFHEHNLKYIEITDYHSPSIESLLQKIIEVEQETDGKLEIGVLKAFRKDDYLDAFLKNEDAEYEKVYKNYDGLSLDEIEKKILSEVMASDARVLSVPAEVARQEFNEAKEELYRQLGRGGHEVSEHAKKVRLVLAYEARKKAFEDMRSFEKLLDQIEKRDQNYRNHLTGISSIGDEVNYVNWILSPVLRRANQIGLKTTSHMGERWQPGEYVPALKRIRSEIRLGVNRLAHLTVLGLDFAKIKSLSYEERSETIVLQKEIIKLIRVRNIHVELNPTSQVIFSPEYSEYERHAVNRFLKSKLSVSLNTDDSSVFDTNPTLEFVETWFAHPNIRFNELMRTLSEANKHRFYEPVEDVIQRLEKDIDTLQEVQRLKPAPIIFGSSRFVHPLAIQIGAYIWTRFKGFFVPRTGAGPGNMEGPMRGYVEAREKELPDAKVTNEIRTQGIRIRLDWFEPLNSFTEIVYELSHFIIRKMGLYLNALGIIAVPGGFGTIDELFEVLRRKRQIFLMPTHFWKPITDVFMASWRLAGLSKKNPDLNLLLTDSVEDAFDHMLTDFRQYGYIETLNTEQLADLKKELREGLIALNGTRRGVVIDGNFSGSDQISQALLNEFVSDLIAQDVPVRAIRRGDMFNRIYEIMHHQNAAALLQAVLLKTNGKKPWTEKELSVNEGVYTNFDTVHQVLTSYHARAFVYFPGNVGTMNRLFDILAAMQTGKIRKKPILLVGRWFWEPIVDVIKKQLENHDPPLISKGDIELMQIVDVVEDMRVKLGVDSTGARLAVKKKPLDDAKKTEKKEEILQGLEKAKKGLARASLLADAGNYKEAGRRLGAAIQSLVEAQLVALKHGFEEERAKLDAEYPKFVDWINKNARHYRSLLKHSRARQGPDRRGARLADMKASPPHKHGGSEISHLEVDLNDKLVEINAEYHRKIEALDRRKKEEPELTKLLEEKKAAFRDGEQKSPARESRIAAFEAVYKRAADKLEEIRDRQLNTIREEQNRRASIKQGLKAEENGAAATEETTPWKELEAQWLKRAAQYQTTLFRKEIGLTRRSDFLSLGDTVLLRKDGKVRVYRVGKETKIIRFSYGKNKTKTFIPSDTNKKTKRPLEIRNGLYLEVVPVPGENNPVVFVTPQGEILLSEPKGSRLASRRDIIEKIQEASLTLEKIQGSIQNHRVFGKLEPLLAIRETHRFKDAHSHLEEAGRSMVSKNKASAFNHVARARLDIYYARKEFIQTPTEKKVVSNKDSKEFRRLDDILLSLTDDLSLSLRDYSKKEAESLPEGDLQRFLLQMIRRTERVLRTEQTLPENAPRKKVFVNAREILNNLYGYVFHFPSSAITELLNDPSKPKEETFAQDYESAVLFQLDRIGDNLLKKGSLPRSFIDQNGLIINNLPEVALAFQEEIKSLTWNVDAIGEELEVLNARFLLKYVEYTRDALENAQISGDLAVVKKAKAAAGKMIKKTDETLGTLKPDLPDEEKESIQRSLWVIRKAAVQIDALIQVRKPVKIKSPKISLDEFESPELLNTRSDMGLVFQAWKNGERFIIIFPYAQKFSGWSLKIYSWISRSYLRSYFPEFQGYGVLSMDKTAEFMNPFEAELKERLRDELKDEYTEPVDSADLLARFFQESKNLITFFVTKEPIVENVAERIEDYKTVSADSAEHSLYNDQDVLAELLKILRPLGRLHEKGFYHRLLRAKGITYDALNRRRPVQFLDPLFSVVENSEGQGRLSQKDLEILVGEDAEFYGGDNIFVRSGQESDELAMRKIMAQYAESLPANSIIKEDLENLPGHPRQVFLKYKIPYSPGETPSVDKLIALIEALQEKLKPSVGARLAFTSLIKHLQDHDRKQVLALLEKSIEPHYVGFIDKTRDLEGLFDPDHPIGEGARGWVYQSQDHPDHVFKVWKEAGVDGFVLNEIRILTYLELNTSLSADHRVTKLHKIGVTKRGHVWLELESHKHGQDLEKGRAILNDLDFNTRLELMLQTAKTLYEMHEVGVLHNDLKPKNIVISNGENQHWTWTLIDFDVAMLVGEPGVIEGMIGGTKPYKAPELQRYAYSDVYSYGQVMKELFAADLSDPEDHEDFRKLLDEMTQPAHEERIQNMREVIRQLNIIVHAPYQSRQGARLAKEELPRKRRPMGYENEVIRQMQDDARKALDLAGYQGRFLTREEEKQLFSENTPESKASLVYSQIFWIIKLARRYHSFHARLDLLQLIDEGIDAVRSSLEPDGDFDPDKGRLSTFVKRRIIWAFGHLRQSQQRKDIGSIHIDDWAHVAATDAPQTLGPINPAAKESVRRLLGVLNDFEREIAVLYFGLNDDPMSPEVIADLYKGIAKPATITGTINRLIGRLRFIDTVNPDALASLGEKHRRHKQSLKTIRMVRDFLAHPDSVGLLTPNMIQILKRRYGLDGSMPTLEEIAIQKGITKEAVRQSEDWALKRIYSYYEKAWDQMLFSLGLGEGELQEAYQKATVGLQFSDDTHRNGDPYPTVKEFLLELSRFNPNLTVSLVELIVAMHALRHPVESFRFYRYAVPAEPFQGQRSDLDDLVGFMRQKNALCSWEELSAHFNKSADEIKQILDDRGGLPELQARSRRKKNEIIPYIFSQKKTDQLRRIIAAIEGETPEIRNYRVGVTSLEELSKALGYKNTVSLEIIFGTEKRQKIDGEVFLEDLNYNRQFLNRQGRPVRLLLKIAHHQRLYLRNLIQAMLETDSQKQKALLASLPDYRQLQQLLERLDHWSLVNYNLVILGHAPFSAYDVNRLLRKNEGLDIQYVWRIRSESIGNILDAFREKKPEIWKRYANFNHLNESQKEDLRSDIYQINQKVFISMGLKGALIKGFFNYSYIDALQNAFPRLGLVREGFLKSRAPRLATTRPPAASSAVPREETRGLAQQKSIPGVNQAHDVPLSEAGRALRPLILGSISHYPHYLEKVKRISAAVILSFKDNGDIELFASAPSSTASETVYHENLANNLGRPANYFIRAMVYFDENKKPFAITIVPSPLRKDLADSEFVQTARVLDSVLGLLKSSPEIKVKAPYKAAPEKPTFYYMSALVAIDPKDPGIRKALRQISNENGARLAKERAEEPLDKFLPIGAGFAVNFVTLQDILNRLTPEERKELVRIAAFVDEIRIGTPIQIKIGHNQKLALIFVTKDIQGIERGGKTMDFAVLDSDGHSVKITDEGLRISQSEIEEARKTKDVSAATIISKEELSPETQALVQDQMQTRFSDRLHQALYKELGMSADSKSSSVLIYKLSRLEKYPEEYRVLLKDKMDKAREDRGVYFQFVDDKGEIADSGVFVSDLNISQYIPRVFVDSASKENIAFAKDTLKAQFFPGLPESLQSGEDYLVLPDQAIWQLIADISGLPLEESLSPKAFEIINQMWAMVIAPENRAQLKQNIKNSILLVQHPDPARSETYQILAVVEVARLKIDQALSFVRASLQALGAAA